MTVADLQAVLRLLPATADVIFDVDALTVEDPRTGQVWVLDATTPLPSVSEESSP